MTGKANPERHLPLSLYKLTHQSLVRALGAHTIDYSDIYRRLSGIRPQNALDRELSHWPNDIGKQFGVEVIFNATLATGLERLLAQPPHARQDIFAPESTYPGYINAFAGRWLKGETPLNILTAQTNGQLREITDEEGLWKAMLETLPSPSVTEINRLLRTLLANGIETTGMLRQSTSLGIGLEREVAAKVIFDNSDPLWLPK